MQNCTTRSESLLQSKQIVRFSIFLIHSAFPSYLGRHIASHRIPNVPHVSQVYLGGAAAKKKSETDARGDHKRN